MKKWIFALLLASTFGFGARLEDVTILKLTPGSNRIEHKLQTKGAPKDSYFTVELDEADPDAFDKVNVMLKKFLDPENYRLDMEIVSFSAEPRGSSYPGNRVKMWGFTSTKKKEK